MNYYDSAGRKLQVGSRLGTGGEGAVFDLGGSAPPRVVKLYHKPPAAQKVAKLEAMVTAADPVIAKVAAWPLDTVHTAPGGPVAGMIMPKVTGYGEIHLLYSPAHRRNEFPAADWGLVIQAARNVAAAAEVIHARGHVIGDVNQKNFTVASNATVMLVDCDSFQIASNGTVHPCEVGVAHFTPPELQGRSFRDIRRTPNHDAFGLAVLCFHLLFMGRHPFAGRYSGAGDMPIERAIREFRFSFSAFARQFGMQPPPGSLPLTVIPPAVATLFERAFGQPTLNARPNAAQWRSALDDLCQRLRPCSRNAVHKYFQALSSCIWCELEGRTGVIFFLGIAAHSGTTRIGFDLAAAWNAIERIAPPVVLPSLPRPAVHGITPRPVEPPIMRRRRAAVLGRTAVPLLALIAVMGLNATGYLLVAIIAMTLIAIFLPLPGRDEKVRRQAALDEAERVWRDIQDRWQREAASGAGAFGVELEKLRKKRDEHRDLGRQQAQERAALEAAKRTRQLDEFLDRFFIDHAKIPKIGAGRKATLASFGIETAADVTYARLASVPGFGPTLVASLHLWRTSIERKFIFDPTKGIDPRELARLEYRYEPARREIEKLLASGPARLTAFRQQIEARRSLLRSELESRAAEWAQARADLDQLRTWRR